MLESAIINGFHGKAIANTAPVLELYIPDSNGERTIPRVAKREDAVGESQRRLNTASRK